MNLRTLFLPAAISITAFAALPASVTAGTGTATVNVSATVASQCNVTTPTVTMAFGIVDVLSTGGYDNAPTVGITCNKGATVSLTANDGNNASGAQKRMTNADGDYLNYSILKSSGATFADCPATIADGFELDATAMPVSTLWDIAGGPQTVTLCGRIETPQELASPGSYTDTVLVTVTF